MNIEINRATLLSRLTITSDDRQRRLRDYSSKSAADLVVISVPAQLKRAGMEMRLVVVGSANGQAPDPVLARLVVRAHQIRDGLLQDTTLTVQDIAEQEGVTPSYATRLLRLSFLAPDIIGAILDGNHPPTLTARKLIDDTRLPLAWAEQRCALGFASRQDLNMMGAGLELRA